MCRESLGEDTRKCRKCQTDLALLAEYVTHLRDSLSQAESLTRAGELGEAVWAYLAVLEVDPDNATARRQVGKVATAVRQFDLTAPGRRWRNELHKQRTGEGDSGWWAWLLGATLFIGCVGLAYTWGVQAGRQVVPIMVPADDDAAKPLKADKVKRKEQGQGGLK